MMLKTEKFMMEIIGQDLHEVVGHRVKKRKKL